MAHILMSIAAKENHLYRYIDIVLYISSTFKCNPYLPQSAILLWKNVYKCIGHIIRKIDLLYFIIIKCATSYVSRMQKNVALFVFSWWIFVYLVTHLKMK